MRFSSFNRPSLRMCLDFRILLSHRPSTTAKPSNFPNSASIQTETLGLGILDAKAGSSTWPPSLFALIIGINEYASPGICNLEGAVADALAVKKYLEEDLGVPASQIRLLLNSEATRRAIIQELNNLVEDQRIHRGDPILVYYAGHGSEADAPKGWESGGAKIQMLIPHDLRTNVDSRGTYGIPDRTIGALLSHVAKKWGDNITVIFDCCHSRSGVRLSESSRKARFTDIPNDVPSDLDIEIWNGTQRGKPGVVITPGFLNCTQKSHVLLAACGTNEVAYEDQGNGIFTAALLKLLSIAGAQNITCTNLLQRLSSLIGQNPQCEGLHRNRALFDAKAQSRGRVLFKAQMDGDNYVMDAGTSHGIEAGDEFTLYRNPESLQRSSPLGIFVVREARPSRSTMTLLFSTSRFQLHGPAFALQTKAGIKQDLRVHVAKRKRLASTFRTLVRGMQYARPDRPRILRVEREQAELGIDLDGRKVVFDIFDQRVTAFNLRRIPFSAQCDAGILLPILDAAAHFHWNLRGTDNHSNIQNKVRLEFAVVNQVEGRYDDNLQPVMEQIGDNLNQNDTINLVANAQDMYGIKIVNDSSVPLYAALFYFDNSNLSITSLYQSPFPGQDKLESPLRPNGSIKLGYGVGDEAPFVYTINEGQDVEVGFLKLFLSTEYVDLSHIPQLSPFTSIRTLGKAETLFTSVLSLDAITVTVVLRKG